MLLLEVAFRPLRLLTTRCATLGGHSRRATTVTTTHVPTWLRDNEASFAPPVMNKLLHREQLSIMFVGGPNTRKDFHLEAGSEFFYQLRGTMELPIVQAGRRELVTIREGEVFLLPSRIPHSPQRPELGSIGLVIERKRYEDEEPDGLRFYTDFHACQHVLWEKYFHCSDLGKDLVPIIGEFNTSEEKATGQPSATSVLGSSAPLEQDMTTVVPPPFALGAWLDEHAAQLDGGDALNLFPGHPDKEFSVRVIGGPSEQRAQQWAYETWLYQLAGKAIFTLAAGAPADGRADEQITLGEGSCMVVPAGRRYSVDRPAGSRGLVVTNDPTGNQLR